MTNKDYVATQLFDDTDFDADSGYDINTYNSIKAIRKHLWNPRINDNGYKMDKFSSPKFDIAAISALKLDKSAEKLIKFVEDNSNKEITGTLSWFNDYVNAQSSFYAVSKYMPVGTIVGFQHPNKVCFIPSEHWKINGYIGHKMDFIYLKSGKRPMVYSMPLDSVELYDRSKISKYGKPQNYKDFAYIYAGQSIKTNSILSYKCKLNQSIGEIIGYAAEKDRKGYIYYTPSNEFIDAGYEPTRPSPNEVIYTINGMNDDNAPLSRSIKLDDISLYTDTKHEVVNIYDVLSKPMPPKGSVDGDHFAVKYAGKKIKATYRYAHYLSAINPWNYEQSLGVIVGVDAKRICFMPSTEFRNAGWPGIINFDKFSYTASGIVCDRYYTIDLANIELMSPKDYEDQNEGILLNDYGLTANQKFAMEYIGHNIIGKGYNWTQLLHYDCVIGKIIGYKGSLICYAPSKEMIAAGFSGEVINDMVYTDIEFLGAKCYTLISSDAIRFQGKNATDEFCYANYGKQIKATGGMWSELFNHNGDKWNLDWPIGDVIGYHQIHHCMCLTPSKKLQEFGFNKGNKNYVGVVNHTKATSPYYQLFDLEDIELVKEKDKPKKVIDGIEYAKKNVGKNVKRSLYMAGWDKSKIVGRVIGHKSNGSIIWIPTAEYSAAFPPAPIPDDAMILEKGVSINTLVHTCWHTSLDLAVSETTFGSGWFKQPSGGVKWQSTNEHVNTAITPYHKKKRKVKDKPWDKSIKIEPLDMPPYIEMGK